MKDISGHKFGKWVAVKVAAQPKDEKAAGIYWLCECECGESKKVINGCRLRAGRFKGGCESCDGPKTGYTKNQALLPTYNSWRAMRERCSNKNAAAYQYYGAKGIRVCDEWKNNFPKFLKDMGKRPKGKTLDRIDGKKGYSKENCRWADAQTQARNTENFKLSDEQVAAIIKIHEAGISQYDLSMAVGVSRSHIANILIGNSRAQPKNSKGAK